MDRVLDLSNTLRPQGVDCRIDQYEESPSEGWPRWMKKRIEEADFVLVVCTEKYSRRYDGEKAGAGSGATWEGTIITQSLYDTGGKNDKFIPIFFSSSDVGFIPTELRSATYYNLDKEGEYENLYRRLTDQPEIKVPPLGQIMPLPPLERKQDFFGKPFNLPYKPNPFFTGREDIIKRLHDGLFVSEETTSLHPLAISGLGGMGKTQTAIEFANRYRDKYKAVFWVDAESRESLISGFISIARLLNLPQKNDKDPNVVIGAAKYWLGNNTDWLLIFDNVDDFLLTGEFTPPTGKGHIIITTTRQATGDLAHKIEIEKMPAEDGILFLLRRGKIIRYDAPLECASDEDQATARDIVRELEGLPLALDQAGAYIEETPCTLKEYLEIFRGQGAELLARRGNLTASHPAPVTTTILISFKKVETLKPEAANLLRLCAFFAPGAIPEEIFIKGSAYSTMQNQLKFYNALEVAGRFSLLKRDPAKRVVYIHGLVQKVLQDQMNKPTCRVWAERALAVVNYLFPSNEFENWSLCERLLPQALIVLSRIEEFELVSKESSHLLHQTGAYLTTRGYFEKAEKFLNQATAIGKKVFGEEPHVVTSMLNNLGTVLEEQRRYKEAEALHRKILEIRRKTHGEEHPDVATSLDSLAISLVSLNRHEEAETLHWEALKMRERLFGEDHPDIAASMGNLAVCIEKQERYKEAKDWHRKALKMREKLFGEDHPAIAVNLNNLAANLGAQKRYKNAETLHRRALEMGKQLYGEEHPFVATSLSNLANNLDRQGKYEDAETLYREAIRIKRIFFGLENPAVAIYLNGLATNLKLQGRCEDAKSLYLDALEIMKKNHKMDSQDSVGILGNLADIYYFEEKFKEAQSLLKKTLQIMEKTYGVNDPKLITTLEAYAAVSRKLVQKGKARELEARAKRIRKCTTGRT